MAEIAPLIKLELFDYLLNDPDFQKWFEWHLQFETALLKNKSEAEGWEAYPHERSHLHKLNRIKSLIK